MTDQNQNTKGTGGNASNSNQGSHPIKDLPHEKGPEHEVTIDELIGELEEPDDLTQEELTDDNMYLEDFTDEDFLNDDFTDDDLILDDFESDEFSDGIFDDESLNDEFLENDLVGEDLPGGILVDDFSDDDIYLDDADAGDFDDSEFEMMEGVAPEEDDSLTNETSDNYIDDDIMPEDALSDDMFDDIFDDDLESEEALDAQEQKIIDLQEAFEKTCDAIQTETDNLLFKANPNDPGRQQIILDAHEVKLKKALATLERELDKISMPSDKKAA